MDKLKTFFTTLYRSFTDPNYYSDVVKAKFSFSFKYYTLYYLLLSLIFSGVITTIARQKLPPIIDTTLSTVSDLYPEDLIINFDVENSTLNVEGAEQPIIIPMPSSKYIDVNKQNLIVIDTQASAEDIDEYDSALLVTDSHIAAISDESMGNQIISLKEVSAAMNDSESGYALTHLSIDKSLIVDNIPYLKSILLEILQYLPYILFFTGFFFFIISRLFILLFLSAFTHLTSLILGKNLPYKKVYQIGLHVITVTDTIIHLQMLIFDGPVRLYGFIFVGISTIAMMGIKTTSKKAHG